MDLKNKIEELLRGTKREGIENLIIWMNENGFFKSPCSTHHHLCKEGGLAEHSFNVFKRMVEQFDLIYGPEKSNENMDTIIICSLLHDIGKCGQYGKPYYVENYLSKVDKDGKPIRSATKPYITNAELLHLPHEIRSLSIVDRFIDLTEEEQFAIVYHNGLYGDLRYQISGKETPLYLCLHFADMIASRVDEVKNKPE